MMHLAQPSSSLVKMCIIPFSKDRKRGLKDARLPQEGQSLNSWYGSHNTLTPSTLLGCPWHIQPSGIGSKIILKDYKDGKVSPPQEVPLESVCLKPEMMILMDTNSLLNLGKALPLID